MKKYMKGILTTMMTKIFMILFGALTVIAIYMTIMDVGVYQPTLIKHSVRDGSAGHERHHGK